MTLDAGLDTSGHIDINSSDQAKVDDNPVKAFLLTSNPLNWQYQHQDIAEILDIIPISFPWFYRTFVRAYFETKSPFKQRQENLKLFASQLKPKPELYVDILNRLDKYCKKSNESDKDKTSSLAVYIAMLIVSGTVVIAFVLGLSAGITILCAWLAYSIKPALPEGVTLDAATSGILAIVAVLAVSLVYIERYFHAKFMDMDHRDEVEKIRELVKAFQVVKLGENLRDGKKEE
ncbi:hypothetical protein BCR33DRAFT_713347 [Rhizoclosmatium globosum]|uniref:Uncharacterized protein n=1 Tax=Rhizoclosmatium globosum TaxID=329046 RepID=A0A1Y2CU40_9FUNG|nr:hypothetical protein BCR33DRAFT_713347 [Rhizoclosmatium globosum]|eukprot:ORY50580.1 hypothetical protein BCR33DRAFT_713347 [Rhizoclosmatium globosum]